MELKGKRVGVIGTGATGIQVIQTIAPEVAQLTVFQRTANYAVAMKNPRITEADLANMRASYEDLRERAHQSLGGFVYENEPPMFDAVPPEQREAYLRDVWEHGSLKIWGTSFADAFTNPQAAACVSEFVRARIGERITNPELVRKLLPTSYEFGTRRVPLENGYFDVFNRSNVELVDLHEEAITEIDATGTRTAARHIDLDVIIFATGSDAGVGSINRIDVRGTGGVSLRQQWDARLRTTVGMQVHGFPNLFMTMAPFAPASAICNVPVCVDQQVDWICQAIEFVRNRHAQSIEPTAETENAWMAHHEEISEPTMLAQNRNSWYRREGANGEKRELLAYMSGLAQYRAACDALRCAAREWIRRLRGALMQVPVAREHARHANRWPQLRRRIAGATAGGVHDIASASTPSLRASPSTISSARAAHDPSTGVSSASNSCSSFSPCATTSATGMPLS